MTFRILVSTRQDESISTLHGEILDSPWRNSMRMDFIVFTLPETNSLAPKNQWLEHEIPFGVRPIFRGELFVSGSVYMIYKVPALKQ